MMQIPKNKKYFLIYDIFIEGEPSRNAAQLDL